MVARTAGLKWSGPSSDLFWSGPWSKFFGPVSDPDKENPDQENPGHGPDQKLDQLILE